MVISCLNHESSTIAFSTSQNSKIDESYKKTLRMVSKWQTIIWLSTSLTIAAMRATGDDIWWSMWPLLFRCLDPMRLLPLQIITVSVLIPRRGRSDMLISLLWYCVMWLCYVTSHCPSCVSENYLLPSQKLADCMYLWEKVTFKDASLCKEIKFLFRVGKHF